MAPLILTGSAHVGLAAAVGEALGAEPVRATLDRFPDGELRPAVGAVRGRDIYVIQPTGPPVGQNLVELLLLLDASRRAGAARVTAVVPYFGYARQDRRSRPGQAVGARVVVAALASAGAQRLVVVDPHTTALEAMSDIPVEMLTAVPVLAGALAPLVSGRAVIVAPDLGAVKLAERYASRLGLEVAVVRKSRISGTAVEATELVGSVRGRPAVVVDDMVSTGATIEAALGLLSARGASPGAMVVSTHGLLVGGALGRLAALRPRRVVLTDSLPIAAGGDLPLQVVSLTGLLAGAIGRLHRDEELGELMLDG